MKKIELTQGRMTLVDSEDYQWLSQWKWHYHRSKKTGYAARMIGSNPQQRAVLMHIAIMKRHKRWKHEKEVDHINTCGCDNRKENLRLATRNMNEANSGRPVNNISGITGVGWHKNTNKWRVRISIDRKQKYLGLFLNIEDAIAARRQAEIECFGEYRHDPTNVCPLGYTGECPDCAARLKELQDV